MLTTWIQWRPRLAFNRRVTVTVPCPLATANTTSPTSLLAPPPAGSRTTGHRHAPARPKTVARPAAMPGPRFAHGSVALQISGGHTQQLVLDGVGIGHDAPTTAELPGTAVRAAATPPPAALQLNTSFSLELQLSRQHPDEGHVNHALGLNLQMDF